MAWFERHYAQRSLALVDGSSRKRACSRGTTAQLAAGKTGRRPRDGARQLAALADRRLEVERMAKRAEVRLARWLGGTRSASRGRARRGPAAEERGRAHHEPREPPAARMLRR